MIGHCRGTFFENLTFSWEFEIAKGFHLTSHREAHFWVLRPIFSNGKFKLSRTDLHLLAESPEMGRTDPISSEKVIKYGSQVKSLSEKGPHLKPAHGPVPGLCIEFRYLLYGQSGFACGAILEKVSKYQETASFSNIYMSIFPGTGSQNEFFPYVPLAAT